MQGTVHNRDEFIAKVSSRLGRNQIKTEAPIRNFKYNPQAEVHAKASKDELANILEKQCENVRTTFYRSTKATLPSVLKDVIKNYGGGSLALWDDKRYEEFGLNQLLHEELPKEDVLVHVWNPAEGRKNIDFANKANVGLTISEITLAESGTVTHFSGNGRGRSMNFLPENSVVLVPKSSLVPRITQAAKILREKVKNGEQVPSCINFITGPSNSADIELILVVGVHGPVRASYILIEDL
jgi:L-lactate dehydrogenase complex protein LldG